MPKYIRFTDPAAAARIFSALQELGGLYSAFAQFLAFRADLLPAGAVEVFRQPRKDSAAIAGAEFARIVRTNLGARGEGLATELESQPVWSTPFRCAYRSRYQGVKIVVQVTRDAFSAVAIRQFERGLRKIPELSGTVLEDSAVLRQFREWVLLSEDPGREHSYLQAVLEAKNDIGFSCPQIIPEISSGRVLSWYWIEGEPVSARMLASEPRLAADLAEMVLEEAILLGVVDGDLDLGSIIRSSDGRLSVRRWNRMIAMPPTLISSALKYLSGVMSGNYPLAVRMLLRLALGRYPDHLESALMKELSSAEPELKGRLRVPRSATVFESNWRSLANVVPHRPLYLDCLHRNLSAVGYWAAEGVPGSEDCIAEAQFAVLGRLLRRRAGDLLNRDIGSEWVVGSGMLFIESLRQISRMADDLRDEDVGIGLELTRMPPDQELRERNTGRVMALGILLILFLFCLHFGSRVAAPWSVVLTLIATVASGTLFWVVVRIG